LETQHLFLSVGPTIHPVADFSQQLAVPKAGRKEVQSFSTPHSQQSSTVTTTTTKDNNDDDSAMRR